MFLVNSLSLSLICYFLLYSRTPLSLVLCIWFYFLLVSSPKFCSPVHHIHQLSSLFLIVLLCHVCFGSVCLPCRVTVHSCMGFVIWNLDFSTCLNKSAFVVYCVVCIWVPLLQTCDKMSICSVFLQTLTEQIIHTLKDLI